MLWLGAATHLANPQGLGMAVLSWRLMGAHGISAVFTVDAGYKAFAVFAFMLFEAQGPVMTRTRSACRLDGFVIYLFRIVSHTG